MVLIFQSGSLRVAEIMWCAHRCRANKQQSWHVTLGLTDIDIWLLNHTASHYATFLHNAKIGINGRSLKFELLVPFIDGTCTTRDWCLVLLVDFRGTDPLPCDIGTGRDSRWRLLYDVYQYFLPENDLTQEGLLEHLQRMAEVPQVKANAIKVNLVLIICVARLLRLL